MAKSPVKKKVLKKAAEVVATSVQQETAQSPRKLPIVGLAYPRHGVGTLTNRTVRVLEFDDIYLRGYEAIAVDDEVEYKYKVYRRDKIVGPVCLFELEPIVAE